MTTVEVRRLRPDDNRSAFRSGNPDLDRFFHRYAGQNQFRHYVGITYVAIEGEAILGYVTVAASHIEIEELPPSHRRRLPHYPLPILRVARLAVAETAQGTGVGRMLLRAACLLAREQARRTGCIGVVVDAKPSTVDFYRRYGFEPLEIIEGGLGDRPQPLPLFLPVDAIPGAES